MDKTRRLANFQALANQPDTGRRQWTIGDVLHGAIGAALGLGVARGAGKVLGLDYRTQDKVESIGMGLGAAMNTGLIKAADDARQSLNSMLERIDELEPKIASCRKHAFRFGVVQALADRGYFQDGQEKQAGIMPLPVLNLNPASLMAAPRSLARGVTSAGELAGTALGVADAMDEDDADIARINIERSLLQEQLERLQEGRRNAALKAILAKRKLKG